MFAILSSKISLYRASNLFFSLFFPISMANSMRACVIISKIINSLLPWWSFHIFALTHPSAHPSCSPCCGRQLWPANSSSTLLKPPSSLGLGQSASEWKFQFSTLSSQLLFLIVLIEPFWTSQVLKCWMGTLVCTAHTPVPASESLARF